MNDLGLLFENGHGVPQDYAQAMVWYRKADAAGDVDAPNQIGELY